MELRKKSVRKWVQDGIVTAKQDADKFSPSNTFTKKIKDSAHFHFHRLCDSFMVHHSNFQQALLTEIYQEQQQGMPDAPAAQHT